MNKPFHPPAAHGPRLLRGQRVRLRPGGLPMTVLEVLADNSVRVAWHDLQGNLNHGRFESWRLGRCH